MLVKEITVGDYKLEIHTAEFPDDPRIWEELGGHMVCWGERYNLGDDHSFETPSDFWAYLVEQVVGDTHEAQELIEKRVDDWHDWSSIENLFIELKGYDKFVVLPLYIYSHGNITIRTYPFACPWDSGQIGWIYAPIDSSDNKERIESLLKDEVKLYDCYLQGHVYYYIVKEAIRCESCRFARWVDVETCGDFYGSDWLANGLVESVKQQFPQLAEALREEL